jgi:hypothetical protein
LDPASHFFGVDARIWQALIAGGVVAVGWLVNGARQRAETRALRAERLRDAHRALFAEIEAHLTTLGSEEALDAQGRAALARMASDRGFVPFVPRGRQDRLFTALEGEIHVLPRVTIDAIVRYYAQLDAVSSLVEDMRGTRFRELEPERRAAIYGDYVEMQKELLGRGRIANRLIAVFARSGKDAAEAEAGLLSSSAGDPSAR